MKKLILVFALVLYGNLHLKAQENSFYPEDNLPKFYLGIGTGINTYTGLLGISANYRVDDNSFFQTGAGLSTWGYRFSVGYRYHTNIRNGFYFGGAITHSTGIRDFVVELETTNSAPDTQEVLLDLINVQTINLKTGYNVAIGKATNIHFDVGYALPINSRPWEVKDGSTLTAVSETVLALIAPGGIILGLGINFGL